MGENSRPEICTEEHLEYLDNLRESGVTNMFGAPAYLRDAFPKLSKTDSYTIFKYWTQTFTQRRAS